MGDKANPASPAMVNPEACLGFCGPAQRNPPPRQRKSYRCMGCLKTISGVRREFSGVLFDALIQRRSRVWSDSDSWPGSVATDSVASRARRQVGGTPHSVRNDYVLYHVHLLIDQPGFTCPPLWPAFSGRSADLPGVPSTTLAHWSVSLVGELFHSYSLLD